MAERVPISDEMTAADLHDELSRVGADLLVRAMTALERGQLQLAQQPSEGVTYAAKIDKAEARIDWRKPARSVLRHIHGLSPFPGAWSEVVLEGAPARIKLLRCALSDASGEPGTVLDDRLTVACADRAVRIVELQRAGKSPIKVADFLRGTPLKPGARFS
jgi:methionyl-tRNA formyltransferase